MHPLVELFMDDRLETYWCEAEQAAVPLPFSLVGNRQCQKPTEAPRDRTETRIPYP